MYHFLLLVLINTIESLITNLFIIKMNYTEAEFLDKVQTKVLRVFLLAIHSHLYNFAENSRNLLCISTVQLL